MKVALGKMYGDWFLFWEIRSVQILGQQEGAADLALLPSFSLWSSPSYGCRRTLGWDELQEDLPQPRDVC